MKRLFFLFIASTLVLADHIVLVDGRIVETKGAINIQGQVVKCTTLDKGLVQLPLKLVNLEATKAINEDYEMFMKTLQHQEEEKKKQEAERRAIERKRTSTASQSHGQGITLDNDGLNTFVVERQMARTGSNRLVGVWEVCDDTDGLEADWPTVCFYPDGRCSLHSNERTHREYWYEHERGRIDFFESEALEPLLSRSIQLTNDELRLENRYRGFAVYSRSQKPLPKLKTVWREHEGFFYVKYPDSWRMTRLNQDIEFGRGLMLSNSLSQQTLVLGQFSGSTMPHDFSSYYAETFIIELLELFLEEEPSGRVTVRNTYTRDYFGHSGKLFNAHFFDGQDQFQMDLFFSRNRQDPYFIFHLRIGPAADEAKRILSSVQFLQD